MKMINLVGNKYGKLTVKEFYESKKGIIFWKCICECGKEIIVKGNSLQTNNTKSCGCSRRKNELDKKYGKLTVKEFLYTNKNTTFWKCICECGKEIIASGINLRTGHTKSCGICLRRKTKPEKILEKTYKRYKYYAQKKSVIFEISFDDFTKIINSNCYYCGNKPYDIHYAYCRWRYSKGIEKDTCAIFNGMDRIIPENGYVSDNVVSCCYECNRMKSDLPVEKFYKKIKEIYEHKISNNTNNNRNN